MKKKLAIIVSVMLVACIACLAACVDPSLKEVEGTYELASVSGGASVGVTKDAYEYFRIILDGKGNGTVQSKGKANGVEYEAKGKYTYADGKIKLTTTNGFAKATETYDYADGVITYVFTVQNATITLVFNRVDNNQ